MNFKFAIPVVVTTAFTAASAQAADLPEYMLKAMTMSANGHIMNVAEQCFYNWESDACKKAIAWSNRAMSADYFDALIAAKTEEADHAAAMVFNDCPPTNVYDWENFAYEVWDACNATMDEAMETGISPAQPQYSIFLIGQQAAEGFGTGQRVLEKSIREYVLENNLQFNH